MVVCLVVIESQRKGKVILICLLCFYNIVCSSFFNLQNCNMSQRWKRTLFVLIYFWFLLFLLSGHTPEDCWVHYPHFGENRPSFRSRHYFPFRWSVRGGGFHLPQHHEPNQEKGTLVRNILLWQSTPTVNIEDMGRQNWEHSCRSACSSCSCASQLRGKFRQIYCWISTICRWNPFRERIQILNNYYSNLT